MKKLFFLTIVFLALAFSESSASSLIVLSTGNDCQEALIKEYPYGILYHARKGDTISGWKIESISEDYVSISKVHNGFIHISKIRVPRHDPPWEQSRFHKRLME